MALVTLNLVKSAVFQAVGFFFTTKAEIRKTRMENLKEILTTIKDEKRTRTAMGWVLTITILLIILYDIIVTGGLNFESLFMLFSAVTGV